MLNSILKIEQHLECGVCQLTLNHAFILSECGHRFCLHCIKEALAKDPHCPTCKKSADLENIVKDPQFDHLVTYMNNLKGALLSHTLTPLEMSLQRQAQHDDMPLDSQEPSTENTNKNPHEEGDPNDEPARKKLKTVEKADKEKYIDPGAFFDDMMPSMDFDSQMFNTPTQPSQDPNSSKKDSVPAEKPVEEKTTTEPMDTSSPSKKPDTESVEKSNTVDSSVDKPSIDSTTSVEPSLESTKSAIPKHIDLEEDATIFSSQDVAEKWECPQCKFANPDFLQTCSICHTYQNPNLSIKKPEPAPRKEQPKDDTPKEKPEYQLTVAGENNTMENVPEIKTRAKTEAQAQREAHILYTGLTPEDDKKLEKIKDEAAQSRLKIIIHYQMRNFDDITHIVTSVNKKKLCKRTLKYLQGVLDGKWIVDPEWLIKSVQSKKWQPEEKYQVQGDQQSGATHAPQKSRENQEKKLFEDMTFYFYGDFTGKHNKNDLLILCRAGGAKIVNRKPAGIKNRSGDELDISEPIVIMNKESKKKPAWLKECQVRDPSWIIDCIGKLVVQ